jgi:HNH endonuclease
MRQEERLALRKRFGYRCGYCGVRERDAGAELTLDHYHPSSKGGIDEAENRVYCCHACNEFKADFWEPESLLRILHPLRDDLPSHMVENDDGTLRALSETGRFHIDRLHLNRSQLVEHRLERRLIAAARSAEARQLEEAAALEQEAEGKRASLEELRGEGT